jgi:CRP-like cAMP-binding protein
MKKTKATDQSPPPRTPRLKTRQQAAEYLGVSPGTLSRWAAERIGPAFVKLGDEKTAAVRYPEDLLEAFVASRLKQPK